MALITAVSASSGLVSVTRVSDGNREGVAVASDNVLWQRLTKNVSQPDQFTCEDCPAAARSLMGSGASQKEDSGRDVTHSLSRILAIDEE